jgi:hypothetical protein
MYMHSQLPFCTLFAAITCFSHSALAFGMRRSGA